ncbi:hypothetical protein [Pseudolysinimonas sp.]|uniref:hypothetical protein n=1 Tax=Pseudolysinimonas sp. TaxID=2680009 RepID=UPI00286AF4D5|nr:hypothetical protein [Pseudolysinimonas sp.]
MPRSNRRREEQAELDLERALAGRLRTEAKRDGVWNVQPQSASSSVKSYLCPGCGLDIEPGTAHVVTWRADGIMGEADDLAARRHWHAHCWKIRA